MKSEIVGYFGVDAGLCWIGDPCYILHREGELPESLGKDWADFCNKLKAGNSTSFEYATGHEGIGVCVSTGYGDGLYPVRAYYNEEGRVAKIEVEFISDEEEE